MDVTEESRKVATRFLRQYPGTPVRTLAAMFNIHIRTAYRVVDDVESEKPKRRNPWDHIEEEIKGMDWQYNPEKDIQHLTIPNYI